MAYYWTDRSEVLQLYTEALSLTVDLSAVVQVEPAVAADIEAEQADNYETQSDHGVTVALDTCLTPELVEEGFVREVISKLQTMRKDAGFEVMDKIKIGIKDNDEISGIAEKNKEEIMRAAMADELKINETSGFTKEWKINGEVVTLSVEKLG